MCLAYPGKVKEVNGLKAKVEYPGSVRSVLIGEKKVKAGDSVLVQMGVIIEIITAKESKKIEDTWKKLG